MSNLCIGKDTWGLDLYCGDICKYKIKDKTGEINEYLGMIFYNQKVYSFSFEHLENNLTEVLMNNVEEKSICKLINISEMHESFKNYKEWKELYNYFNWFKLII